MKAVRLMAIALLTSLAAILVFSSAAGHRLQHESPTVIFDYDVTNDYGILFADEFERLGGAEALGYPASYRFRLDDGFVYQVTQGALLQWRPEVRKAYLGNTFEMLEKAGYDQWLLDTKGIPLPIKEDGSGGDWNKARQTRLAWLTNENIKAKYLANPNPEGIASWSEARAIELYGLPMSYPEKHGPFVSQRFQRVAFQLWVDEVEGMPAVGTVVRVLGGDLLKEACLVPSHALAPAERSSCASSTITLPKFTLAPLSSAFTLPGLSLGSPPPPPNTAPASNPPPSKGSSDPPPQSDPPRSDPPRSDPTQVPDPPRSDPTQVPDPPRPPPPRTPAIRISGLVNNMDRGDNDAFTVEASNLVSSASYDIQVSTNNANVGFDAGCADQEDDVTVPAGDTSHTSTFTLHACSTGSGTVTATLSRDGSTVDTDTHSLTVTTPPPPPTPAIRISELVSTMDRGDSDSFTVTASNLVSSVTYTIDVSTDDTGIGFDSDCSDREEEVTVQSKTLHAVSLTLYGCATAGGTVTATLSRDGSTVDTATQTVTVLPPGISIEISDLVSSFTEGETETFEVAADNLDSSETYKILLTSSNGAVGFHGYCGFDRYERNVPANRTSYSFSHSLKACATPGDTVKATLLLADDTEVISATQYVTVEPDLSPKIQMWGFFGIYKVGAGHSAFNVKGSNLESSESYRIQLTLEDNEPAGKVGISFDSGCTEEGQTKNLTVPAGSASYTANVTLESCDATFGSVTAELQLVGGTEDNPTYTKVTSATDRVTVAADVRPRLWGPDRITRGSSEKLGFTVEGLDSASTYTVVFETSAAGLGFNSTCSDKSVTKSVSGKTYYTVTAGDFSGSDTLYGCTGAGGTVTAKVYRGTDTSGNAHRNRHLTVRLSN